MMTACSSGIGVAVLNSATAWTASAESRSGRQFYSIHISLTCAYVLMVRRLGDRL
jgi:hypothetical protein